MPPYSSDAETPCCRVADVPWHGHEAHVHAQTNGFSVKFQTQDHAALDHILDMIVGWSQNASPNMTMRILPSISPLPQESEFLNFVRIDIKPGSGIASARLTMFDDDGTAWSWYPKTDSGIDGALLCWDTWNAPECMFPSDAAIRLPELRAVVHQFYDLHGARLPDVINWQQAPDNYW